MSTDAPAWYEDAVYYELPVKAFADGNHDGVGDFVGLTAKLDYLTELGVSCLWLLPFQPSPLLDDGYDVADYRAVHPRHGRAEDFRAFVAAAHERGLRVAAEMAVNHTSTAHPWFQAARAAPPGSPLRDYYHWSDSPERFAGAAPDGRPHWSWDDAARTYYWHRFADHQPDLNYDNPLVREEMLRVLRFWLQMGVDGLCLNGASYLVERDGTPCENLPQTHAVLRDYRRRLEANYPGRMIQAGMNQWPPAAAAYFGDGDECHLAPNVPLAQRLFLALRQEDRHPLEDILHHTPAPPPGCQWVTLLRNHDELTLTLATDDERDYMHREYAADPRLRARQGILRRLAPLLDNSRPRIELLFGLLFSLPGAPVIYYGDEIGMGDNPFLGDRNAVRTPMQWSADRNAGFSSADFARLYAPPVMDPVHGYQAVNVEAQRSDPSSLFHAVRRLIALRRRHPAFARGNLELLEPSNRRAFACLRKLGDETLLVVANLSRTAQPVELDLGGLAGLTPVELAGRTPFPPIRQAPYLLTLSPHALHWFSLQRRVEEVAARRAPVEVEELGAPPTIEVEGGWAGVLDGAALRRLERDVLPAFLRSQRWFGGKARSVERVRLRDSGPLADRAWLALFEVTFTDGGSQVYHLPLGMTEGLDGGRLLEAQPERVLARLRGAGGEAVLHDALADDGACTALLDAIGRGAEVATRRGVVRAFGTAALPDLRGDPERPLRVVCGPATSSNSLVCYGRRLLLKLFRRLEVGVNPDFEVGRFLTEREHFDRIPSVAGTIEYHPTDSGQMTLAILQALVPNQGDGWGHAVDELGRYFERARGRMLGPDPLRPDGRPLTELAQAEVPLGALEVIDGYLHAAATLGRRTAEMHLALGGGEARDPDFAPQPLTPADLAALAEAVARQGREALAALREDLSRLPEPVARDARRLLDGGEAALRRLARPPSHAPDAVKTRVHGDYHLGQVLWVDNDFVILDFEGEPTRPVEERRARQSPLKDVAGMLRSFDYAAFAGLFGFTRDRPDDFARLEPWARLWQQWASAAFLRAYRELARGAAFLPARPEAFAELLDLFLLEKAFYELVYELNNRPDWVRIPLSGVLALLGVQPDGAVIGGHKP
jgi:maltose alpha-D-glucosyltransferase/alpha-amylase